MVIEQAQCLPFPQMEPVMRMISSIGCALAGAIAFGCSAGVEDTIEPASAEHGDALLDRGKLRLSDATLVDPATATGVDLPVMNDPAVVASPHKIPGDVVIRTGGRAYQCLCNGTTPSSSCRWNVHSTEATCTGSCGEDGCKIKTLPGGGGFGDIPQTQTPTG